MILKSDYIRYQDRFMSSFKEYIKVFCLLSINHFYSHLEKTSITIIILGDHIEIDIEEDLFNCFKYKLLINDSIMIID